MVVCASSCINRTIIKNRFFSLIEMLVVVAIIMILLSLLQPALRKAIGMAQVTACLAKQKNIGMVFMLFTDDHKGYLPATSFGPGGLPGNPNYGDGEAWQQNFFGSNHIKGAERSWVLQSHWHRNIDGPIWDYLDENNYKKFFLCPSTDARPRVGNGHYYKNMTAEEIGAEHSNGVFDYAGLEAFGGALQNRIPTTAYMLNPAGRYTISDRILNAAYENFANDDVSNLEAMPTPLLVEESPAFSINNGLWSETSHGSIDEMGTWHINTTSVYTAVDGSAHAVHFNVRGAKPREWRIEHPTVGMMQMTGFMAYGHWNSRTR